MTLARCQREKKKKEQKNIELSVLSPRRHGEKCFVVTRAPARHSEPATPVEGGHSNAAEQR